MEMAEIKGLEIGTKKEKRLISALWVDQMTDAGLKEGGKTDGKVEYVSKESDTNMVINRTN